MKKTAIIILVVFFSIIIGCKTGVSEQEIVMTEGMEITATTSEGTIRILAGKGFERIYTWDSCARKVTHWPRKQRWYGSKGIYYPGPGFHWKDCNGVKRAVVEEGQQHFASNDEAMKWIRSRRYMDYVYRNDGLMVGWHIEAHTLSCEVWQILINGSRPDRLEGSKDAKISIIHLGKEEIETYSKSFEVEEAITSDEIKKLEEKLKENPQDLETRGVLIDHYFQLAGSSKTAREGWKKHMIWIVKNYPHSEVTAIPMPLLDPGQQVEEVEVASELWLEVVESNKDDVIILDAAAKFFTMHDLDTAERLLKHAKALEPDNPFWADRIALIYEFSAREKSGVEKTMLEAKALKERERANELSKTKKEIFYRLAGLAKSAFKSGDMKKAMKYSEQLLKEAENNKNDWNYGNAVHHGNLILGRIALKSGDIEKAKYYLIEAGKTPGSPQLNSFGPNMTLAKELLEKGEREVVIKYFQLCEKFWEMDMGRLKEWTSIVKKSEIPDFGPNLVY